MPRISQKRLSALRSRAASTRRRAGGRGRTRRGRIAIFSGRTVGRALLFNVVRKVGITRSLGPYSLPADLAITGTASKALNQGGGHLVQTAVEIGMSRAFDQHVFPRLGNVFGGGQTARAGGAVL